MQLHKLRSDRLESIGGQPIYSAFLFPNSYGIGHGPFSSDDELWAEMSLALAQVPEQSSIIYEIGIESSTGILLRHTIIGIKLGLYKLLINRKSKLDNKNSTYKII